MKSNVIVFRKVEKICIHVYILTHILYSLSSGWLLIILQMENAETRTPFFSIAGSFS